MQHATKLAGTGAGNARATLMSRLMAAVLALILFPAFAATPSGGGAPLRNPHLASLQIEIWPEFDRPAALVILRGELAADAPLPADVTLRIAAATGGPSAMAYSETAGGSLLSLEHEQKIGTDFITLRFKVPRRYFHVEFYDPLATDKPDRSYTYVWPGDLEADKLRVIVQEPAASSNFSVQPNLDAASTGTDGLRYRSADLGARKAGMQLPVKLRYTKTDTRTSAEILQPQKTPDLAAPAPTPVPASGADDEVTKGVLIFTVILALLVGVATAFMWWRGREETPAPPARAGPACAKCGTPRPKGARFCSNCGARLK